MRHRHNEGFGDTANATLHNLPSRPPFFIRCCTILMLAGGTTQVTAEWLDGRALNGMVSDKTAICRHLKRPSWGRTYFSADGTMHGIRRGETRQGSWFVRDDTLCTNWGARTICSRYRSDGQGGHFKFTLKGKKTVHIEQWLEGDQVYSVDPPEQHQRFKSQGD